MSPEFSPATSRAFRLRRSLRTHKKSRGELPRIPDGHEAYAPAMPMGLELKLSENIQGDSATLVWLADLAGQPGAAELRVQTFTVSVAATVAERVKKRLRACPIVTELECLRWIPPTPTPLAQDVDVVEYLTAWGTDRLHTLWLEPNRSADGSVLCRHAGNLKALFGLELPAVRHLALPGLELSHRGMRYLQRCKYIAGLHSLDISGSKIDNIEALAGVLEKATELKLLSLANIRLDAAGLAAIVAATPALTELDIRFTDIEPDAKDSLMALVQRGVNLRASYNKLPHSLDEELRAAAAASGAETTLGRPRA